MHPTTPDVIIIGGGRTGQALARALQAHGCVPHLVEALPALPAPHVRIGEPEMPAPSDASTSLNKATDEARPTDPPEHDAARAWSAYAHALLDEAAREGVTDRTQPLQDVSFLDWLASCLLPRAVAEAIVAEVERGCGAPAAAVSALYGLTQVRAARLSPAAVPPPPDLHGQPLPPLGATLGARALRITRTRPDDTRTACTVEMLTERGLDTLEAPFVITALPPAALCGIELVPTLTPQQWAAVFSLETRRDEDSPVIWPPGRSPFDTLAASLRVESQGLFLAGAWVHEGRPGASERAAHEVAAQVAICQDSAGRARRAAAPNPTDGGPPAMIQEGQPLPDFNLENQDGATRTRADYAGHWLVLYIYPKDDTPGCTVQARAFTATRDAFEQAGIRVVGLSPDDVASHKSFCNKLSLNVELLADPSAVLLNALGAGQTDYHGTLYWNRTTFVADPQGIIRKVYTGVRPEGHEQMLLADVAELQKAHA